MINVAPFQMKKNDKSQLLWIIKIAPIHARPKMEYLYGSLFAER